jgi:hypothetical protein
MLIKLLDFLWPVLESPSKSDREKMQKLEDKDLKEIRETDWGHESDTAIEEARRIALEEDERRKTAESKASNLLMVAATLVPLLTYLETAVFDDKAELAPKVLTLPLLGLAIAYFGNAAWWAFRTVGVGSYHRIYPVDLTSIWRAPKKAVRKKFIAKMLSAVRKDQETVNQKVTSSKMTHAFLLRAVMAFSALLIIRISFQLLEILK